MRHRKSHLHLLKTLCLGSKICLMILPRRITKTNYSVIFYSCQFIKSFWPFHSFWEEDDLSGRSIQAFQNDTIIISWLFSFRVIQATAQWHTFKTFMFVFINSSSSQKLFCQVPNQYRSLMTFRNKIQAKTFTRPDTSFYAR